MSDITVLLEEILEKRYGKDVRQAIHDAIEQCYTDGKAGAIDMTARQSIVTNKALIEAQISSTYDTTKTYAKGQYSIHEDKLYKSLEDGVTGTWNASKWQQVDIGTEISDGAGSKAIDMTEAEYEALSEDVQMNGSAYYIKDGSPIPYIMLKGVAYNSGKVVVPLTSAEYEALTEEQQNNGLFYRITDKTPKAQTAAGIVYGDGTVDDALDGIDTSINSQAIPTSLGTTVGGAISKLNTNIVNNSSAIKFKLWDESNKTITLPWSAHHCYLLVYGDFYTPANNTMYIITSTGGTNIASKKIGDGITFSFTINGNSLKVTRSSASGYGLGSIIPICQYNISV